MYEAIPALSIRLHGVVYNKERNYLHRFLGAVKIVKSRRLRWAGHDARKDEIKNA
jgi:hypothetical protein